MKASRSPSRRQPTAEQKQAAQERREAIKKLMEGVRALPEEKRILLASQYGIRTCEGRELSPYNQCLLAVQFPTVSVVGGFSQWRAIDRIVKKGSKALAIWIPKGSNAPANTPECTAIIPAGTDPADVDDTRFLLGNVFDISQTETLAEFEARKAAECAPSGCAALVLATA